MTAELMYHKAKQTFEDLPNDKQITVKNFSSALTYLFNEKKCLGKNRYLHVSSFMDLKSILILMGGSIKNHF